MTKTYRIEGMGCAACAEKIENRLNKENNVKAKVDLEKETVAIQYDENQHTLTDFQKMIDALGYDLLAD